MKAAPASRRYKPVIHRPLVLPKKSQGVCAGFPSPAEDYLEEQIDLAKLLCHNHPATFLMWVDGNSMKDAGIFHGDLVVVDKSVKPVSGDIVIACVDGHSSLKKLVIKDGRTILTCQNADYPPYPVLEEAVEIWGVVRCNIHWAGNRKI